ncbi:hypothetical protein [Lysinibacillus sp. FJAT-14222]|uniref:hypothetical protein n=1 Tax=Lysinibacillus sp. FJAT-14222 TaxID=1932366 RepID=UPI0018E94CDF|nr:hypothetical protein [Lysinibacillus sp. FJAT-14222]
MMSNEDERLLEISTFLEETSLEMANERRDKRNVYFKCSVENVVELEIAAAKVEDLLWFDRLVSVLTHNCSFSRMTNSNEKKLPFRDRKKHCYN